MVDAFGLWELNFPCSRVDDDDDEEEQITKEQEEQLCPQFVFSPQFSKDVGKTEPIECSVLVLGVGEVASTFLEVHFLCGNNSSVAAVISDKKTEKNFEYLVKNLRNKRSSLLHQLTRNNDVMVCQISSHVEQDKVFYWTQKIFSHIRPAKVVILTSSPASEYNSDDPSEIKTDFVKMMKTNAWSNSCAGPDITYIQTPNTVKGLAASVLTHCQIYKLPAALFMCYTESMHVDAQAVEAFRVLFGVKDLFRGIEQLSQFDTSKL
ncbi:proteasome assembly chaperone 1 isoform X2 [Nematostella vectensis]|uniref:proteasome assembly chaperone 1 isoform X2 n=1 Tax=Nematostella vectensis TaxID=45351 RepID=UPI0020770017|nr:proteasome assembly chaperone 1 isoform X2 [Nematostella vectensis]